MLPSGLKRDPGDSIFSLSRDAIRLIPMMGDMVISDRKGKVNIKWVELQYTFNKTFLGWQLHQVVEQHVNQHFVFRQNTE
jgi:hypothetical protein